MKANAETDIDQDSSAKRFASMDEFKRRFLPDSFRREGEEKSEDTDGLGSELVKDSEKLIRAALATH